MEEIDKIELRSEEVQEIMGHIPSRIIRYGITVIFSVILVVLVGSFFFKYPDVLVSPIEVLTENPPAAIVAKTSGNLQTIFVADSQLVKKDSLLAVIKNPALFSDVLQVHELLDVENVYLADTVFLRLLPENVQLGDVQLSYATLLKLKHDYFQFRELNYYPQKISALQIKSTELEKYAQLMENQVKYKVQDYQLSVNEFKRDSLLFKGDVISLAEFEAARKKLLQIGLSLENTKSNVVNTRIQLQDLKQQIVDMEIDYARESENYRIALNQAFQQVISQLATWFDNYVLLSPINGRIAFNKYWSENQYVNSGDEVFTVIPEGESNIIGRISLAAKGAGKVKPGQGVNIKFDKFNHQEFGMISSCVVSISAVPSDENYIVEVFLPDTLVTNYGYLLPFTQRMAGTAEIITEDLPLIVRLFNPIKSLLKKHLGQEPMRKVRKKQENESLKFSIGKNQNSKNQTRAVDEKTADASDSKSLPQKVYHIIVGSYVDQVLAAKKINYYNSKGYKTEMIQNNKRFRLSVFVTSNKTEAFRQLEKIRTAENDQSIWVLAIQ